MTDLSPVDLLERATPFLDVRAPGEFARGAVPGAVNLPILDDAERQRVGITYKQQGADAAVKVGHRLVSGALRDARIAGWREFAARRPDAWICCWRGGQRSGIAQRWLAEAGVTLPRVPGGFKALRHACLAVLDAAPASKRWILLGGRTGSGKTALLRHLDNAIDLESLANHRGSAFGAREQPQPAPVTFENALACAWLRHPAETLVLEDESRTIGRLALPERWYQRMQSAPIAMLEVPLAERCTNIAQEYIVLPRAAGASDATLFERYDDALGRIERRLGGARRAVVRQALIDGFTNDRHEPWIELLLRWYYDPMYDHQLARKSARIVTSGDAAAVRGFLAEY